MGTSQSVPDDAPHGSSDNSATVCIVGAGMSGLRAAQLLATAGFQITLLEARDCIGGRIHQNPQFGMPLDMGACWMHGTEGNPIVALAEEAKSSIAACGAVSSICDSKGNG